MSKQIWENFQQRQGFSSNNFQQNFQAQFFNNLGNFPPISAANQMNVQQQQQQQPQQLQKPDPFKQSEKLKQQQLSSIGGGAPQINPLLQNDYDMAFSTGFAQSQTLDPSQRGATNFYSDDNTFPMLTQGRGGQAPSQGGLPMVETSNFDNVRKFPLQQSNLTQEETAKMKSMFLQQQQNQGMYMQQPQNEMSEGSYIGSRSQQNPPGSILEQQDSYFIDVYSVYSGHWFSNLQQTGRSALLEGGLDTGIDTRRLLPVEPTEHVSSRLIRPYSRVSAMLDPMPQNEQQVNMETLWFEDDCLAPHIHIPESMKLSQTGRSLEVTPAFIKRAPEKILFYMFYNMPFERQQHDAAKELETRGWKYDETNMRWSRKEGGQPQSKSGKGSQISSSAMLIFDPERWDVIAAYQ